MHITQDKTDIAAFIHAHITRLFAHEDSAGPQKIMDVIEVLAGFFVESCFLFEKPDLSLSSGFRKLEDMLRSKPYRGELPEWALPEASKLDARSEQGRALARFVLDEWKECEFSYMEFVVWLVQNHVCAWEGEDIPREESLRFFIEAATRCMAYEIAAQELCDLVIEKRIGTGQWSLADSVCGLSGFAGYCYARNIRDQQIEDKNFAGTFFESESIVNVMTQEAARMGVPAGSDWRLGMVANDSPADPPIELIESIEPICLEFFKVLSLERPSERAVACAKAAGRMLAVVASGDTPDMPHAIAKPLAMAALIESYRGLEALQPYLKEAYLTQDSPV